MERNPANLTIFMGKLFVFAYTWSFGGVFDRQDEMDDDGGNNCLHSHRITRPNLLVT